MYKATILPSLHKFDFVNVPDEALWYIVNQYNIIQYYIKTLFNYYDFDEILGQPMIFFWDNNQI